MRQALLFFLDLLCSLRRSGVEDKFRARETTVGSKFEKRNRISDVMDRRHSPS
jgi:hypothetical protein